ncbi:22427_t:CDS:2, partial [Entrophospora sp. SA101]
ALKQGDLFSDNKFLGKIKKMPNNNDWVNKVAGKLHISDIVSMGGLSATNTKDSLNFSHRIDEFSFGTHYPLLVNPLDNSIEISQE